MARLQDFYSCIMCELEYCSSSKIHSLETLITRDLFAHLPDRCDIPVRYAPTNESNFWTQAMEEWHLTCDSNQPVSSIQVSSEIINSEEWVLSSCIWSLIQQLGVSEILGNDDSKPASARVIRCSVILILPRSMTEFSSLAISFGNSKWQRRLAWLSVKKLQREKVMILSGWLYVKPKNFPFSSLSFLQFSFNSFSSFLVLPNFQTNLAYTKFSIQTCKYQFWEFIYTESTTRSGYAGLGRRCRSRLLSMETCDCTKNATVQPYHLFSHIWTSTSTVSRTPVTYDTREVPKEKWTPIKNYWNFVFTNSFL